MSRVLADVRSLAELLAGRRVVVLTGAGVSTDSGIPDYRGPLTRHKARNPIQYKGFVGSAQMRQRYWARSLVGWPRMAGAAPNATHRALAELEACGAVVGVITQNVDGLHGAAGSRRVVELHGALSRVVCLGCGARSGRAELQDRLLDCNPGWLAGDVVPLAPDGDAEVAHTETLVVPECVACGGVLKPDVVFFGENVPPDVTSAAWELYAEGEVLLVLGSSLVVFSGYRFVHRAHKTDDKPVAIVTLGPTRGDGAAAVRVDRPLGEVVPLLASVLMG